MIRLQRVGRKNYAEFRVVVTEKTRAAKSSNFVELLGHYNPHTDAVVLNAERVKHWMSVGAQVSGTVFNILVDQKLVEGKKKNVLPKKTPVVKDVPKEEKKPTEAPKTEEKKEDTAPEATVEATEEK